MTQKQYLALVEQLSEYDHQYYVLDQSQISDKEYDTLIDKLLEIESKHPEWVVPHSPSQRIGSVPESAFEKYERPVRMYSLDNTYNEEELRAFYDRVCKHAQLDDVEMVVEPKIDGLSVECVFENDRFVLGATRGDGQTGEIVTHNLKTIRSIPLKITPSPSMQKFSIRGEVYLDRSDLGKINELRIKEDKEPFKNPRNAASGSLRLLDAKLTAKRPLKVIFYEVVQDQVPFSKQSENFSFFHKHGLPTHASFEITKTFDELFQACVSLEKKRASYPYDLDGVVIKVNDKKLQKSLSFTSKYPKWAIAYKFATEVASTKLLNVTFQVGRTGVLTPVAHFEPIFLAGTTVSKASLHNIEEMAKKDVRIGDTVVIEKAGEIIPQVLRVDKDKRPKGAKAIKIPTVCPACGSAVGKDQEEDVAIRCFNTKTCPAQIKGSVVYFCSRKAMNIENVGPSLIDQLLDRGLIEDAADLFALSKTDVSGLDRMADKSAQNIVDSIESAKKSAKLERVIMALGIPLVGERAALLIAQEMSDFQSFAETPMQELRPRLLDIHGIGPNMVDEIEDYLSEPNHQKIIQKLLQAGLNPHLQTPSSGSLSGKTFVVTGKLSQSRDAVHALIQDHGGKTSTSVSENVDYLVCNAPSSSSKYKKAQKLKIPTITEDDLQAMLSG